MLRKLTCAVVAAALYASDAFADTSLVTPLPGYVYFNRPAATLEQHDSELRMCLALASRLVQPDPTAGAGAGGGVLGALVVGVIRGIQQGMATRRGLVANTENCMVLHGWRMVQLDDALGAELAALEPAELATRLQPMITAAEPPGVIVRTFNNEVVQRSVIAFGPAGDLDKIPLSIAALTPIQEAPPQTVPTQSTPVRRPRRAAPPRALNARRIAALAPDSTLVVVHFNGNMGMGGTSLSFLRTSEGNVPAGFADGLPDFFTATLPQPAFAPISRPHAATLVFEVPPGRWRLSGMGHTLWNTSFCFGAPFFDLAAGEVAFIHLDLLADVRAPTFSNEIAQGALAGLPSHVVERARMPQFTNGATSECGGSSAFYVWELPGAPFIESYALGSRHPSVLAVSSEDEEGASTAPATPSSQ